MNSAESGDHRASDAPPAPHPQATYSKTAYWQQSLRIVQFILLTWFLISLGCGVLFRTWLDASLPHIGGAPFGFWMAQQGSILGFLLLLVVYMFAMNRLDERHGYQEGDQA